jgi:hypothetical protein
MLVFLHDEPDVKAPTTLLDCDYIVRQINDAGSNAMVALCCGDKTSFFFFREGKEALAYYSDASFERAEGMTVDEEMLLYAYQPGVKVQAFIFRDMNAEIESDSNLFDQKSLHHLLTVGYLENRRKTDSKPVAETPATAGEQDGRQGEDVEMLSQIAMKGIESLVRSLRKEPALPSIVLAVESGVHQGEHFTVTLPCTIGRKDCDLILDDRLISRQHAVIKIVDNKLIIEDMASKNGTRVNGKTVARSLLVLNDLITVGPSNLRVSAV